MERLQVILAGRAAEEIAFTSASSYSINDLKVGVCVCAARAHIHALFCHKRAAFCIARTCTLHGLRCICIGLYMYVAHIAVDCCQAFSMSCRLSESFRLGKNQPVLATRVNSLHTFGIA